MTSFVFIRHGQTDANQKGQFAGKTDDGLNPNGILQSQEAAKQLKGQFFDAVFCGNTKRVLQTFEIIRNSILFPNDRLYFTDDIREIDFGDWEGMSADEISAAYGQKWQEYMDDWSKFTFPNGEGNGDYFAHCSRFIRDAAKGFPGRKIAVFGHKGFILACACALRGLPISHMFDAEIENGAIFLVNIAD